jgi:hypothetical protein
METMVINVTKASLGTLVTMLTVVTVVIKVDIDVLWCSYEEAVAQFVETLRYKLEGRGFDSRWIHWNFLFTYSFRPHYGPGVDSVSNRNEFQQYFLWGKGGRCAGLTILAISA